MNSEKTKHRFFAWLLAGMAAALVIRAFYGFCWSDESFYLTFAQRLWNGQKLILDEWHPVQFYSVIFYPILTAYRFFFGTEGIYLFSRLLYLMFAFGTSELVYGTFSKRFSAFPSFLCAASVLVYSRGNIWGPSYYNLFLLLVMTALCLATGRKKRRILSVLAGICLGFSVLCVPYFAIFVLAAVGIGLWKKADRSQTRWVLLGICSSAAYFILLFLPGDLGALLRNLNAILSDPEHASGPFANLETAVQDVRLIYSRDIVLAFFCGLYLWAIRKWMPQRRWVQLPGFCLVVAGAVYSFWRCRRGETGFAAYSYCIYCLALFRWDTSDPLDLLLRRTGAAMAVCMAASSNTEAIGFTVGLCVYSMGLILPLSRDEKRIRAISAVLGTVMICMTFSSRITTVFRDGALDTLTETMSQGPAKGLHTTKEGASQYNDVLDMLHDLKEEYGAENTIFFTKILPWGYLACDYLCGAPTAWRTELGSLRLLDYYQGHPAAIPKLVVVLNPEIGKFPDVDTPNENEQSGWLWEYMEKNDYTCRVYPCARVYIAPDTN